MNKVVAILVVSAITIFFFRALNDPSAGVDAFKNKGQSGIAQKYLTKTVKKKNAVKGKLENSSANVVTAVVVDYRGFDTMGEVTVLFAAIAGIGLLLFRKKKYNLRPQSYIVKTASPWIIFLIFITGAYIFIHGHLTPGGGFPGGAMIAAGFAMILLSSRRRVKTVWLKAIESLAGVSFVSIGLIGLFTRGSFLENFLKKGTMGELFSGGFIMLIYAIVGFKVAAELSGGVEEPDGDEEGSEA